MTNYLRQARRNRVANLLELGQAALPTHPSFSTPECEAVGKRLKTRCFSSSKIAVLAIVDCSRHEVCNDCRGWLAGNKSAVALFSYLGSSQLWVAQHRVDS